jgi:uncharacterized protein DUF4158
MSTHIKILSKKEIQQFDNPPVFTGEERKKYFSTPAWANNIISNLKTTSSKIGFIIQLGYFRAVGKFFVSNRFNAQDIFYVTKKVGFSDLEFCLSKYNYVTSYRHQIIILSNLGYKKYESKISKSLEDESFSLCSRQLKPRLIIISLINIIKKKKIVIPSYFALSEIITKSFRAYEQYLLTIGGF